MKRTAALITTLVVTGIVLYMTSPGKNSHDVLSSNSHGEDQPAASALTLSKGDAGLKSTDSANVDSVTNPSADNDKNAEQSYQKSRYDREAIAKLDTVILGFIQKSKDLSLLTEELNNLGFEITTEPADESQSGQTIELRATAPEKGIHSLQISFDVQQENKLDLSRIQLAIYPDGPAYNDLVGQFAESLGEPSLGVNSSKHYRSWPLGDQHLWIDQYDAKDPFDPQFKQMVVLTYEPDVEGEDSPQ